MMKQVAERLSDRFRLPLKDALFLGFCAVFAVLVRLVLRLHLHISGHAMIIKVFFLMLGRGSTPCRYGASFTGLLAGTAAMFLGFAKAGPLIIFKYLIAGMVIDVAALFLPMLFSSYILCALVAAAAASTKFFTAYGINAIAGMDKVVNMQRSLLEAAGAIVFGMLGGLMVPMVVRRLRAYGVVR
ncbi:membrane protein, putative [Syntrophotalea carbinolica DSM 2380]|uniref:Membrane protein, putative n=1 Tax=Syntrophotalea carbinolica (strain DSM 2380 / NBRC 103641 / GraBd1) TaxID=338963 RepID=Q3A1X4_SYNC1|nr:hypothetical protein [Syntrophotalea carbinolica]ABA89633.1 membrane protein, putative [Syntrophotalea carbinolica DSM 2380]